MSDSSELAQLLMGQVVTQATCVRVLEPTRVGELQDALREVLNTVQPDLDVARNAIETFIDALGFNGEPGPTAGRLLRVIEGGQSESD